MTKRGRPKGGSLKAQGRESEARTAQLCRVAPATRERIARIAARRGFLSIAEFLEALATQEEGAAERPKPKRRTARSR